MSKTVTGEGAAETAAGHGFITGTITGFIIVAGITLSVGLNAGAEVIPAFGMAAFAGFWGGPGFGGMIGATLAATRAAQENHTVDAVAKQGTTGT